MTVSKSKRQKSRFEVFHNMQTLQKEDEGRIPLIDVQNSFKSWLGTYNKLLSYRTKNNMKALYKDLFER